NLKKLSQEAKARQLAEASQKKVAEDDTEPLPEDSAHAVDDFVPDGDNFDDFFGDDSQPNEKEKVTTSPLKGILGIFGNIGNSEPAARNPDKHKSNTLPTMSPSTPIESEVDKKVCRQSVTLFLDSFIPKIIIPFLKII